MSERAGSEANPLRVAIVGTGPAGMYAAGALLAAEGVHVRVDLFDKLPAPFGLVRYGVAPDHQKIKSVVRVFDKTCRDPRVRYFGNVAVGRDLSREDLECHYHQLVYAVGAQGDRELGVPGEDLAGSISSTELVNWYNGHPELADVAYPLDHERVAVVGIGNVAMDVARILAKSPDELAKTDIAEATLAELRKGRVREIWVLARRGPVQAKCSPPELKEIAELEGVQVLVEPRDLELDAASEAELAEDRAAQKNLEIFRDAAARSADPSKRHVRFRFNVSPIEVLGEEGRVSGLRIERNALVAEPDGRVVARGTGETETLPVTLVVRAIGYRSHPLVDLPFDPRRAVIPNDRGRVIGPDPEAFAGSYVVGWVKRGPSGLIGSNKMDAQETVDRMLEEVAAVRPLAPDAARPEAIPALLQERGVRAVSYEEWCHLDGLEVERGKPLGRPRLKMVRVSEMLAALAGD